MSRNETESAGEKITVIGSGTMGAGIAQVCVQAGFIVTLQDVKAEQLQVASEQISRFIWRAVEKGQLSSEAAQAAVSRLTVTTDLVQAAAEADWVIEAIYESMEAKRELFTQLDQFCPSSTVFASNTSGLSISEIGMVSGRPHQTVGLHFFNPIPLMKLVEVVRGNETTPEIVERAVALGKRLGKTVVVCSDAPNFIVNRVNRPVYLEAQRLLEEGIPAQSIDTAMVLGAGFKMGPLQTSDLSGVQIGLAVTEHIFRETGDPRYRPVPLVRQLVQRGHIGKQAGKGFYLYPEGSDGPVPRHPDILLPSAAVPQRVAVIGEGQEAHRWRGKLLQAGLELVKLEEDPALVLVPVEASVNYRNRFLNARIQYAEEAVYTMMDPLLPLEELARLSQTPSHAVGLYCPLPFLNDAFFEVHLGLDTAPEAGGVVVSLLDHLDCTYVVTPEIPAGIVLRIVCALINEAAFALQEGLASAEDIDLAVRLGMNYGLGPFEYADRLGLDVVLATLEYLQCELDNARYRPALLLRQMVRAGRWGQRVGRGFYTYG